MSIRNSTNNKLIIRKTPIRSMAVILLFMLCPLLVWAGAKVPKATYVEVMYFHGTLMAM